MLRIATSEAMLTMHTRAAGGPLLAIRASTKGKTHGVHLDSEVFEKIERCLRDEKAKSKPCKMW